MATFAAGDRLGRYEIVAALGAGGMGEVYRARDTTLDREVAIKVLPSDVAGDPERLERFKREAKAVAALSHPNIIAIHDFATDGNTTFAVTELLEGETLRTATESRVFSDAEAARIAREIAHGLSAAHSRGIIHRDIKPENLFITRDGVVKILDFGLATLRPVGSVAEEGDEMPTELMLSQPGMVMGTLGYMAPEQLRGEPADHRSDLFALGSVMYEMLSGRRPFEGKTAPEIAGAILQTEPKPLTDVDINLSSIVHRCLEKRPEDRFGSARDVSHAIDSGDLGSESAGTTETRNRFRASHFLAVGAAAVLAVLFILPPEGIWQRLTGDQSAVAVRSIVVLPLENLSGDPGQEFFADGMTDELIMNLSKIEALDVISRTTAMHYKGSDESLPTIAGQLGVDAVIEGTVLQANGTVRISVQLIHGETDRHLWAQSYQRPLRDVLLLQSEVARAVAREIHVVLTPADEIRLTRAGPVEPAAHRSYLKGMHHFMRFTGPDIRKAMGYFEEAISVDPAYADAYAGLAAAHLNSTYLLSVPPSISVPAARENTTVALELEPNNPGGLIDKSWIAMTYDWDWQAAEHSNRLALEINPGWEYAHNNMAFLLSCLSRFDEGLVHLREAENLDPLSLVISQNHGWLLYQARRYDEAVAQLEKTLELNPQFWFAHQRLAHVYLAMAKYDRGIETARRSIDLAGEGTPRAGQAVLAQLLAAAGRREEALAVLAELEAIEKQQYLPPTDIARVHAALGHTDEAFQWLDKAVAVHDGDLFMTKVWPAWDPIRQDPRFDVLLQRLNFSP